MRYLAHWYATHSAGRPTPPAPRAPAVQVRVFGGENTPQIQAMAERFHAAGVVANWARHTGSDPETIRRAMGPD